MLKKIAFKKKNTFLTKYKISYLMIKNIKVYKR